MKNYELVVIYDSALSDEAVETENKKMEETIKKLGGQVSSIDKWGRRKLAYIIKKKREGVFSLIYFQGSSKTVLELDRALKIYEPILRHMIVRQELPIPKAKEEPKAAPAAPKEEPKAAPKEEVKAAPPAGAPQEAV